LDHHSESNNKWGNLGQIENSQGHWGQPSDANKLGASVLGHHTPSNGHFRKKPDCGVLGSAMQPMLPYEEEDHNLSPLDRHREPSTQPKIKEQKNPDLESLTSQKKSENTFVKNASYSFKISPRILQEQDDNNDKENRHSQTPNLHLPCII
jgi:hypothetical protein